MIVLSASPRSGKTTFCSNSSFATLYDRIKSNAFFGSLNHTVLDGHYATKSSNSTIHYKHIPGACILDSLAVPPDGTLVNILYSRVAKSVISADDAHRMVITPIEADAAPFFSLLPRNITNLTAENYLDFGVLEPAYVKVNEFFYPLTSESYTAVYCASGYNIDYIILSGFYDSNSPGRIKNARLIGVGLQSTGHTQVSFAMIHRFFENGINFCGLPYINIAEAGPSAPSGYITSGHGQFSNDYSKLRRVFTIEPIDYTQDMTEFGVALGVSLIAFAAAGTLSGISVASNVLRSVPVLVTLKNLVQTYKTHKENKDRMSDVNNTLGTNYPFDPTSFVLMTNRAYFDSIIDLLYTSSGATLSGGIPADVIRRFINTQLHESIGIYSALGDEKVKDPFHSLATDAHMAGQYSFVNKKGWPDKLNFTTRNTKDRFQWYSLVSDNYIYANHLILRRCPIDKQIQSDYILHEPDSMSGTPIYHPVDYKPDKDSSKSSQVLFRSATKRMF